MHKHKKGPAIWQVFFYVCLLKYRRDWAGPCPKARGW